MNDIYGTIYDNDGNVITNEAMSQSTRQPAQSAADTGSESVSEREIFEQIRAITADSSHIREALVTLEKLETRTQGGPNDAFGIQGKAEAIANVVQARENTNLRMIALLEKIYDRHYPSNADGSDADSTRERSVDSGISRFESFCEALRKFTDEDGNYPSEVLETLQNVSQQLIFNSRV